MVTLDTASKFTILVKPVDAAGNPGTIDGPPSYPVDTQGVLTILPSADGLSCECRGATVGTCTITPTATAAGAKIVGPDIQVTCVAPPQKPATQLVETVSPVVPQ